MTFAAFKHLREENSTKEKTKHIMFDELKMNDYLKNNKKTGLSTIIFSVRSQTLDIKTNWPWSYESDECVACEKSSETMDHFMKCTLYESTTCSQWRKMYGQNEKNTSGNCSYSRN